MTFKYYEGEERVIVLFTVISMGLMAVAVNQLLAGGFVYAMNLLFTALIILLVIKMAENEA